PARRHDRGRAPGQAQVDLMRVEFFLLIAALLFAIGCVGVLIRRNAIVILMCIEIMLNAVNLTFVAFAHENQSMTGHVFVFFIMTVAAAEAAVGLAIVIALFRRRRTTDVEDASLMRWRKAWRDLLGLVPLLPFAGFAVNGLLGARFLSRRAVAVIACAAVLGSFLISWGAIHEMHRAAADAPQAGLRFTQTLFEWLPMG